MTPPPYWVALLTITNGDPLRAQELEEGLSEEWWDRLIAYRKAQTDAKKAKE